MVIRREKHVLYISNRAEHTRNMRVESRKSRERSNKHRFDFYNGRFESTMYAVRYY
jgi:hypothetical protein